MRSRSIRLFLVKAVLLIGGMIGVAPIRAETNEKTPERKTRSIVTEVSVGLPILYFRNQTAQGTSTSLSLFGYFIDAAFCPSSQICGTITTHSHIDIRSGRRVFDGPDVGIRYFILGKTSETALGNSLFVAEQQSNLRSFFGFSLSQRDFDFRTVVEDKADVFVGTRPNLEGSFWSAAASMGVDLLLFRDYRIGFSGQYHQSISASSEDLKISQILFDLRLLNLTF